MNVAEILRGIADKLDSMSHSEPAAGTNRLTPVDVDNTDHSNDDVMITPLQQKQELLKKAAGVESFYDTDAEDSPDELALLKRNAGMPVVVQTIAGEDNDILG
jgi:hypothetical protein